MKMPEITLEPVQPNDLPTFKQRLQDTFTQAAREAYPDFPGVIPPERDMDESLSAPGAESLQIVCDGEPVGGAIVTGGSANMMLDFIFVDSERQDRHLGYAAWRAIEERYPDATHWELVTPYHEKRNIHFYINRCGFHITEYYNEHHPDPHFPHEESGDYPGEGGRPVQVREGFEGNRQIGFNLVFVKAHCSSSATPARIRVTASTAWNGGGCR